MAKCKHPVKERQAVASSTQRYGSTQIVVVCLECGSPIYHSNVHDENGLLFKNKL